MNLFINAVSKKGVLIIFDDNKNIIKRQDIEVLGNESSKLVWIIDDFLNTNNISYNDLENIVVVNGPGSFTGIRTISLIANTINYVIKKDLTEISYFDLFNTYPICKPSSKRDSFIKKSETSKIEIIQNTDLENYFEENNIKKVTWELNNDYFSNILILDEIDYENIISNIKFNKKDIIKPLYIKKPNIS